MSQAGIAITRRVRDRVIAEASVDGRAAIRVTESYGFENRQAIQCNESRIAFTKAKSYFQHPPPIPFSPPNASIAGVNSMARLTQPAAA